MNVRETREAIRQSWMKAEGDPERTEDMIRQRYPGQIEVLCYADELMQFWIDNNITEPSVVMSADEPRAERD